MPHDPTHDPPRDRAHAVWFALALLAIVAVGIALRVSLLDQAMRYDEGRTYMHFAARPDRLFDYRLPNNHILHTILVEWITRFFGEKEWALRLPAFGAGVLAIPLTAWLGARLRGRSVGLIAAALVATSGFLIAYSAEARGYTIMACSALGALLCLDALRHGDRGKRLGFWAGYALCCAVGVATIPASALVVIGAASWFAASALVGGVAIKAKRWLPALAIASGVGVLLGASFYLPAIREHGLSIVTANRYVAPQPWDEFTRDLARLPDWITNAGGLLMQWPTGTGGAVLVLALVGVVASFLPRRWRSTGGAATPSPLLAMALVAFAAILYQHRVPMVRGLAYLLPPLMIEAGFGAVLLAKLGKRLVARRAPVHCWIAPLAATALAVALGAWFLHANTVRSWRGGDYYDGVREIMRDPDLAALLNDKAVGRALIGSPEPAGYYKRLYGIHLNPPGGQWPPDEVFVPHGRAGRTFIKEWRWALEREGLDPVAYDPPQAWATRGPATLLHARRTNAPGAGMLPPSPTDPDS